jgi:hypothetical protein
MLAFMFDNFVSAGSSAAALAPYFHTAAIYAQD